MDPTPIPELELVEVTWRDANFAWEAADATALAEEYLVKTVGWLLADGPVFLRVAAEVLPAGDGYRGITSVPVENVLGIRVLGG